MPDTSAAQEPQPLSPERVLAAERTHLGKTADEPLAALCFSGGGVRSASFCLGVLQALSRTDVLDKFDYLSTVSGGGYIGGWLSSWRCRAARLGHPDPCGHIAELEPGGVEPHALASLRAYIKYLTPRTGLLSADVWTLVGTMLRNLVVNWLVLIPVIAAAAMVPRLYLGILGLQSQPELVPPARLYFWFQNDWIPMSLLVMAAVLYAAVQLPSFGRRQLGLRPFLLGFLAPILVLHFLVSVHRYWAPEYGTEPALVPQLLLSAAAMALPWMLGSVLSGGRWRPAIWIAAAVAGAAGRYAAWHVHVLATILAEHDPQIFVVLDFTTSLLGFFFQIALFIGLASRQMTDEDREWWARAGAWILISALTWGGVSAVVILGPLGLNWLLEGAGVSHVAGRAGLGVMTVAAGLVHRASAVMSWFSSGSSRLKAALGSMAAPFVALALMVLASDGNGRMLQAVHARRMFTEHTHPMGASLPEDLIGLGLLVLIVLGLGQIIAVNRFSLHSMYRARLVRTFLGACRSKEERRPSPFTGFDENDDLKMSALAPVARPMHVVNATLNTVDDNSLATTERKAKSFTFTALHAGSESVGYRPAGEYAGGVTLGDAVTTSGAAANSNMGADATGAETFLLTLFNARLGLWLGNPGEPGQASWRRPVPSFGVGPLLNELTGRTTDRNPYVNLSDGGHFENLAVYEMIRRRCRTIVAVDSGADPTYAYNDLANLIRKVRVDFGVEITFPHGVPVGPPAPADRRSRWALATIDYKSAFPDTENGVLLYIKPVVTGDEPVDVANYAKANPPFPHQATTNQWFGNAEFESYRALGWHTIACLTGDRKFSHARGLCEAAAQAGG